MGKSPFVFNPPAHCTNGFCSCENQAVCLWCHWNVENIKADQMDIKNGILRLEPDEKGILRYRIKK